MNKRARKKSVGGGKSRTCADETERGHKGRLVTNRSEGKEKSLDEKSLKSNILEKNSFLL